ncbi:hypothetical protein HK101_011850 [Irineochytrium annulatum]|nr:hypothetical protein HK101_011850 [Irineochytrium annulatum]
MELCVSGDLMTMLRLRGSKGFEEERVRAWSIGVMKGLEYLHVEWKLIHRDLKLQRMPPLLTHTLGQNILVGSDGSAKICDFGFASILREKAVLQSVKGTPIYMSPEMIQEEPYDHRVDLWSLGVIIYELWTGKPPFFTTNIFELIKLIIDSEILFPTEMDDNLVNLLRGLLEKNQQHRLNWPELSFHPYMLEQQLQADDRPATTDSAVILSHPEGFTPTWSRLADPKMDLDTVSRASVLPLIRSAISKPHDDPESADALIGVEKLVTAHAKRIFFGKGSIEPQSIITWSSGFVSTKAATSSSGPALRLIRTTVATGTAGTAECAERLLPRLKRLLKRRGTGSDADVPELLACLQVAIGACVQSEDLAARTRCIGALMGLAPTLVRMMAEETNTTVGVSVGAARCLDAIVAPQAPIKALRWSPSDYRRYWVAVGKLMDCLTSEFDKVGGGKPFQALLRLVFGGAVDGADVLPVLRKSGVRVRGGRRRR